MRRGVSITLIFIAAFVLYFLSYDYRSEQKQQIEDYTFTPEELALIQDGDICLRHGYGIVSDGIATSLSEEFHVSHCAILVKSDTAPMGFRVIHAVSQSLSPYDGVQEQSLPRFIRDSQRNSLIVVRLKNVDDSVRHNISKMAEFYLEKRVPFDHNFDISDSSKFYCSELPWMIIKHVAHIDIFKDKINKQNDHTKFSNFWNPDNFEIIINHNTRR